MASTWSIKSAKITGDLKTITIQETVDGVDTRTYSESVHKTAPTPELKEKLKKKINDDRKERQKLEILKAGINFTNFETFLNS